MKLFIIHNSKFIIRFFRWSARTPRRKAAWVLLVAYLVNQFVYPLIPFLKDNSVKANGVIEPVTIGTSLFVNRNPEFNVWFGDRLDQSKHKIVFEVSGHEIEMRLRGASESSPSGEIDELIANLRKELQKPYLTTTNGNDSIDQKIGDKATIRYEILPNRGVKESILIQELGARSQELVSNRFVFEMKLSSGVQLKTRLDNLVDTNLNASTSSQLLNANSYYFTDSKGKYLAHFEPLIMTDAAGAMSNDIKMDITNNILTLTANPEWLNASERVFPIDLDPTIVHDQNPDFSSGTENRTQINSTNAVESQFKELQTDINTVGLWHFNEGSGTTAYDSSGNSNTGTLTNGPVWNGPTDTQVGLGKSSLKFDGNAYISVPDSTNWDFGTRDFTIDFWYKDNGSGDSKVILHRNVAGGYTAFMVYVLSGNVEFYSSSNASSWDIASAKSMGSLNTTGYSHYAVVRNGTSFYTYKDGVQISTWTSSGSLYDNNTSLGIGGLSAAGYTVKGFLDDLRISNKARTPEEIAASASRFPYSVHESPVIDFGATPNTLDSLNYTATGVQTGDGEKPYSRDGLIAQWNFNETSGTTAYNMAGSDSCGGTPSSCNLTLNNFASTSSQDQAAGTGWTANDKRWGAGSINISSVATADTISLSNPSTLDPNSADLSVETWVKTTDVTAELFSNNSANGVSCTSDGYYLGIDASGYPVFTLDTDGATAGCDATITSGITQKVNDGKWHHLAAVVKQGSAAYLYLDGVVVGSDTSITAYTSEAPSGNVLVASTNNFDGTLDSLRFYARALSASEVLANFQVGNIEFQTRTGATSTPNDGTWEAWKTTSGTGDTQIAALDNVADIATPSASIWQGVPIATSSSALVMEGTGSLRTKIGAPQVDSSTVALWHMDETSGTSAYIKDSSASVRHGTPSGTTVVDGFYGKGRNFNGSSDYISAADTSLPSGQSNRTVSAWIKTTTTSESAIVAYGTGAGGLFQLEVFQNKLSINFNGSYIQSTGTINDGKWRHVAVTQSGTSYVLYIDGIQDGSGTNAASTVLNGTVYLGVNYVPGSYFAGAIDEVKVDNVARTADEIAEAYRAGRDHRISKTISSTDLSAKTKLPFYVASDRPGTFMEATVGESALVNYEAGDSDLKGYWHLDEVVGIGKDSSGNGHNLTDNNTVTSTQGKIGKAGQFTAANSEYLSIPDNAALSATGSLSIAAWFYLDSLGVYRGIVTKYDTGQDDYFLQVTAGNVAQFEMNQTYATHGTVLTTGVWYFVVAYYNSATGKIGISLNGDSPVESSIASIQDGTAKFQIGASDRDADPQYWNGRIDEVMFLKRALTADERRQLFEVGKRTHPITIDFKADLDSSNLIADTSDLSFAIQPDIDIVGAPLSVARGEKIIVKENVNGTEYLAQGTVTGVTYETNTSNVNAETQDKSTQGSVTTVTVTAWDSGSTVPSGGFTTASTVFKWQREYMDLSQIPLSTQRDAITRITLRVTDGSQGSNVWLDDFESADYSDGSRVAIGSTAQRYFQYRAVLNAQNSMLSPTLTNVTINYNSGTTAQAPKVKDASTDFSATGTSLDRVTDTGSSNSPSLELAYKELSKDINTVGLWHFNEGTGTAADSSGNGYTGTLTNGAAWNTAANSKLGASSVSFDRQNDIVAATDAVGQRVTGSITIEAWVKSTYTGGADAQTIVAKGVSAGAAMNYAFGLTTGGVLRFYVADAGTINTGTKAINDSTWHHTAVTFDPSTDRVLFYVDGVLDAVGTNTQTPYASTCHLVIGGTDETACNGGPISLIGGSIDEVRISNIARTPEEIKYDAGRRPYGVYTSDVQNLGTKVSSIDNIRWTENGVQTGDGEVSYGTSSLVAQWNFNETSGTTAAVTSTSSCGSSCNGTLTTFASTSSQDQAAGTGWTKDNKKWGGGALMFDGTDDYVSIADNTSLRPTNVTVETWINTSKASASKVIVDKSRGTGNGSSYLLAIGAIGVSCTANTTSANFEIYNGTTYKAACGTTSITDGKWHHIVATYDGVTINMYQDGVLNSSTATTQALDYSLTSSLNIGRYLSAGNGLLAATIDTTRIYSRALTASEILSNYQSGNIELQTRTGTTATPNDGTWEEWRPSGNSTEVQLDNLQTLSPVQKINTTNLVGYWKLDEVSGNRADSAGSNTLTDNATVTSKAGHLNLAGQFTAANSEYLSITDNTALSLGDQDFTVSAWVYLDSLSARRAIVSKTDATGTPDEFVFMVETDGSVTFQINNAGGGAQAATAAGVVKTGTWYHLVAYHDSVNNTVNIVVNNGSPATTATGASVPVDSAKPFEIGRSDGNTYYMDGRIDEVAMWKRVLTADERRILYEDGLDKTNDSVVGGINRTSDTTTKFEGTGSEKLTIGAPQVDSSTVALWHMDETSGSSAYIKDATANAYNGTPSGTTLVDGYYSKGRSFNGTSDKIYGTPTSFPSGSNDRTVEAWVKTTQATEGYFFGYGTLSSTQGISFGVINSGKLVLTQVGANIQSTGTINDNKWHHVAFTQTGSTQKMYIDGAQDGSGSMTVSTVLGANNWNIGLGVDGGAYFSGSVDEVKLSNVVKTADEIAEAYRAGRDHRISKTLTSTDLTSKTKLPFYVASDRPGTFMEATVGESALVNYEAGDPDLKGLWHLDENSTGGAAVTRKDSSGNGNDLTDNNTTTSTQGKIGKAGQFTAANSEYLSIADNTSLSTGDIDFTFSGWFNANSVDAGENYIVNKTAGAGSEYEYGVEIYSSGGNRFRFWVSSNGTSATGDLDEVETAVTTGNWIFFTAWHDSVANTINYQVNNGTIHSAAYSAGVRDGTGGFAIGRFNAVSKYFNGSIDEIAMIKRVLTADERRQMYEIGKRTHQITNDFVTTPQATYSSGTSVTINNPYGTTNLTDTLNIGDTIIFKENVNGTETVSQGTVTGVTNTASTYGTVTLLAAPTFPSGGYTTNATVFKWQREYFDISSLSNLRHLDATTRLTLRVTDGSQGANIWLDDLKAAGPYLTQSTTRTASVTSTPRQFMQYRIIFSTTDPLVSPTVTSVSVQTHSSPVKVVGSDTLGADGSFDKDGNLHLGSNNVKKVAFYDRTKDQISYALDFDGSNDVVTATDNSNWTFGSSDFTVELWANLASTAGVSTFASHYFQTSDRGWYFQYTGGNLGFGYSTNGTSETTKNVSWTPSTGIWYHLAATRSGNNLMMYVDGTQQGATQDVTGVTIYDSANELGIGSLEGTGPVWTNSTNGRIDEVAIFSDNRTVSEIVSDMNARRLTGTEGNLVGLWHFDEGAGTRAYDSSGNNNHGTLTNMAATAWVNSQNDRDQSALSVQTLGIDPNWANGVGRESYALNLDGTGDNLIASGTSSVASFGTGDFTIEAWVYPTTASGDRTIASVHDGGSNWLLKLEATTNKVYILELPSTVKLSTNAVDLNAWSHIAWTRSGTSNKMFINGVEENSWTGSSNWSTSNNINIGSLVGGYAGGQYFVGNLDEIRISKGTAYYTSNFTPSRRLGVTNASLLYHLDEGADNLCSGGSNDACDATSNAYDAAISGNPTWNTDARAIMDNNARYVVIGNQSSVNSDKGMEIKITSTTAFQYRWTGDQTWTTPSTSTLSSYSFLSPSQIDSTGVYVGFDTTNGTFGDESYFLIPSWAIQQFSTTRGVRRSFPERSYLVATDRSVDIIDADDNTLWMRTTNGVANNLLGTQTLNVPSSVTMAHGQLVVGTNGTAGTGVYRLDFNRDTAYRYNVTNRTTGNNNLAKRNATDWSWGSADTGQNLIDSIVNDVSLLTSNGRLVMATANNTGLTKIANIMSNDTSYDYSDVTSNAYNRVKLAENYVSGTGAVGDMYALNSTNNALERWNNVVADSASETNGTPDATVNATSTPALFASAQTVNDLDIKTGTSLANSGNNTVFVGHNGGTTVFQENRATLASSSVKYYTKDYIGEEMVGATQGMWPIYETSGTNVADISKINNPTTATGTTIVTGVREKARSYNGSSDYVRVNPAINLGKDQTFTVAAWVKTSDTGTYSGPNGEGLKVPIITNYGHGSSYMEMGIDGGKMTLYHYNGSWIKEQSNSSSLANGSWHYLVWANRGTNMDLYIDGALDKNVNSGLSASTTNVGAFGAQSLDNPTYTVYGNSTIDEVLVTTFSITTTQVQQMYVAGKEALNNKYRVKLASDTVNQLAGSINVVKAVTASDQYIFAGTNTTGADDGILSRVLLRGDVTDKTYDESSTDPLIVDNDINSVAVSKDGAYIIVGTDDQGITIIHNGTAANRLRSGGKVQGPSKRPSN